MDITITSYELVRARLPREWEEIYEIGQRIFPKKDADSVLKKQWLQKERSPYDVGFLLKFEGASIGIAYLRCDLTGRALLESVGIIEDKRNGGHGRVLMEQCERFAREKGVGKLFLDAHPAAIRFYEKVGFEIDQWTLTYAPKPVNQGVRMTKVIRMPEKRGELICMPAP